MNEVDDDELLRRCQQGDNTALTQLVQLFEGRVFRLAMRVLNDAARAEEAAADALATVWLRCRSWRGESKAGTWIQQVAWRVILDHHRRRRRWRELLLRVHRFWVGPENPAMSGPAGSMAAGEQQKQREQQVAAALVQLSAEDRALVHWHYFENQSLADIALTMQVSRDALKMRLSRARQQLRTYLQDPDEHE